MLDNDFNSRLNELIDEIKQANQNSSHASPSYLHLIAKLGDLSMTNIESRKDAILYFIADIYDGSEAMEAKVSELLLLYT